MQSKKVILVLTENHYFYLEAEFTNKKTKPAIAKKERNGPILEMNCVSSPMIVLEAEIHKEKAKAASSKKGMDNFFL